MANGRQIVGRKITRKNLREIFFQKQRSGNALTERKGGKAKS